MLKMTIDEFDELNYSDDVFDNLTGGFLGVFDFILENWAVNNGCKLYEFEWDNVIIMSIAHKQEAIDAADYDDDFEDDVDETNDNPYYKGHNFYDFNDYEDDVDETNYDPYMGCNFYDLNNYEDW